MTEDSALLRCYAEEKSEPAFAELVGRHINFVYGCALRRVGGNAHLAQDVTQQVFLALARSARSLAGREVLSGWLYTTVRYVAAQAVRAERRRAARERAAQTMNDLTAPSAHDAEWERLRPVLDAAMDDLSAADREAVLLRFFEGRSFPEIGAKLRVTDNGARMRVERALEKLHDLLTRRGLTSTSTALGVALAQHGGVAAPAGLAASVLSTAMSGAAAEGGLAALAGIFAMTKLQTLTLGALALTGAAVFTLSLQSTRALAAEVDTLRAQSLALAGTPAENARLLSALAAAKTAAASAAATTRPPAPRPAAAPTTAELEDYAMKLAGMKPSEEWKNVGRATPAASFETTVWAYVNRDYATLGTSFGMSPAAKTRLDAWFASLPPAVQAKRGTPEAAIAPAFAEIAAPLREFPDNAQMMQARQRAGVAASQSSQRLGYKIVSVQEEGPRATVEIFFTFSSNSRAAKPEKIMFQRVDGAWLPLRIAEGVIDQWTARIDPATGELLPWQN